MRVRARVEGTVQGVGFRPYVYRLSHELGLGGWVLNDAEGVVLEVEGAPQPVDEFFSRLEVEAPPLALVERVVREGRHPTGEREFTIRSSATEGRASAPVTPDSATCEDCLRELLDPTNRRYRYPFINCTNCGPRFTIVRGVPYDRPLTTMAAFQMCQACRAEYEDPSDRRFHAQPNACPACGPSLAVIGVDGEPFAAVVAALDHGAVAAIKGIGGYHLACRADDEGAVARLRGRKHREDKPFALMAPTLEAAEELVALTDHERRLLSSRRRPIVLARRRPDARVAASVAPGSDELGVMLPYSPLHHLLLGDLGSALVLTSGNISDEPIAFTDEDALERLAPLADLFLIHDRPIETRTDDSVVRVVQGQPLFVRRSRGYVPDSLTLHGGAGAPLLACGAELKNTFCLAKGERAWVSHHIGDLENYETLRSFTAGVEHFERLFDVRPEVVAHDLHPEYLSTKYAVEREQVRLIGVQHHHAHLAGVLAEHDEPGPAVGVIYDGSGWGGDGTLWGGEILCGDRRAFRRVGHLRAVPVPGGERAVREPWRMAVAWLIEAGCEVEEPLCHVDRARWAAVCALAGAADRGLAPLTSSAGRLFDAVAALCGLRTTVNYEGQAAIELERVAGGEGRPYRIELGADGTLDPRPLIRELVGDVRRGEPAHALAARFHAGLALATVEAATRAASTESVGVVVLSGGVFGNRRLLALVERGLSERGLRVLVPRRLPPGDGGISFGQAAVAAAQL
ncbi:MAG TPA: carbamoyltransferase HypF [Solirubrobacteraceae bacterium]|nr:carbamoyltransferase HypF [Solirubrobacteraceae bacterium]